MVLSCKPHVRGVCEVALISLATVVQLGVVTVQWQFLAYWETRSDDGALPVCLVALVAIGNVLLTVILFFPDCTRMQCRGQTRGGQSHESCETVAGNVQHRGTPDIVGA